MFTTRVDEGTRTMPIAMRAGWLAGHVKAAIMGDRLLDTGKYKGPFYCADDVPPTLERIIAVPSIYSDYEVTGLVREFAGSGAAGAFDTLTMVPLGIHSKAVTEKLVSGFASASVAGPSATSDELNNQTSTIHPVRQSWESYLQLARNR